MLNASTSRYYSVLTPISIILFARLLFFVLKRKRFLKILYLLLIIPVIQLVSTFNAYRNNYINDIQEVIERLRKEDKIIIVPEKEKDRLNMYGDSMINTNIKQDLKYNSFVEFKNLSTKFLGGSIYIISKEKVKNNILQNIDETKIVCMMNTNKGNSNKILIQSQNFKSKFQPFSTNNNLGLINNGDIEIIEKKSTTLSRLKKWIDDGCTLYNDDNIFMPENELLVNNWGVPSKPYPTICASSINCISGNYSLHVKSFNKTYIYFFNRIKQIPEGILSFSVKNLGHDFCMVLNCATYSNQNQYLAAYQLSNIIVLGNDVEYFQYYLNSHIQENLLFFITVDKADFLIDDINFIPIN